MYLRFIIAAMLCLLPLLAQEWPWLPDPLSLASNRRPLPSEAFKFALNPGGKKINPLQTDCCIDLYPGTKGARTLQLRGSINRCVSYELPMNADQRQNLGKVLIQQGCLAQAAELRLLVQVVVRNPDDARKRIRLTLTDVNGSGYNTSDSSWGGFVEATTVAPAQANGSGNWYPSTSPNGNGGMSLVPIKIHAEHLIFGMPRIYPDMHMNEIRKDQAENRPRHLLPLPGENQINFAVRHLEPLLGGYDVSIHAKLFFRALDPIILIHGTAADHTTWEEPASTMSLGPLSIEPPLRYFKDRSKFRGIWFYKIDLFNKNNYGDLGQVGVGKHIPPNDEHGNGEIGASGAELRTQMLALLEVVGLEKVPSVVHEA